MLLTSLSAALYGLAENLALPVPGSTPFSPRGDGARPLLDQLYWGGIAALGLGIAWWESRALPDALLLAAWWVGLEDMSFWVARRLARGEGYVNWWARRWPRQPWLRWLCDPGPLGVPRQHWAALAIGVLAALAWRL